jgi:hypothetical protein
VYRDAVHYVNGTLVGTPAALLRHPEALVYAPEHGHLRLAALEISACSGKWAASLAPSEDAGPELSVATSGRARANHSSAWLGRRT